MKTKLIYQATNQEVQVGDLTTIVGSSIRVKVEKINFDLMTVELSGIEEDHECRDVPFRRAYAPEKIGARFATSIHKTASVGWTVPVAADHALLAELGVPGHASTEQFARSMSHARAGYDPKQVIEAYLAEINEANAGLEEGRQKFFKVNLAAPYKLDLSTHLDVTYLHLAVSDTEFTIIIDAMRHMAASVDQGDDTTLAELIKRLERS
jgi:hypothetical protein